MKLLKYFPLIFFIIISIFFYNKIKYKQKFEPLSSALIEKKFPQLSIYNIDNDKNINKYIENRPVVINIFASWCGPCRIEHKVLKRFSNEYNIVGIAYKDSEENIDSFINEFGNPYEEIFFDFSGTESINLGLYGVPETFFINSQGTIMYKHVGPINEEDFKKLALKIFNNTNL